MNRFFPFFASILVQAALFPALCPAQSGGFKAFAETGLEPVRASQSAPASKPAVQGPQKAPTEITAQDETTFDERSHVAVFIGTVVVKDPQFNLTCDKLTAYLAKGGAAKPVAEAPASKPTSRKSGSKSGKPVAEPAAPAGGGALDHAVAEGNVIVIQDKKDEATGEITHYTGKGAKGEYDAHTGDMKLTGWPQIQQGLNNQVSTSEGTIMIMNRDGRLKTIGPSKSVIVDQSDSNKGEKGEKGEKSEKSGKGGKAAKPEAKLQ